jgi:hypothetical protein
MLVEHIIDPIFLVELVKSPRNCKDFRREFTKPSPRVIGKFPKFKNFRRLAFRAQSRDVPELELQRLTEMINLIGEINGVNRTSAFNGEASFIQNLATIDNEVAAHKCLLKSAAEGENLNVDVISIDSFDAGIESISHQRVVPKIAEYISEVLASLLRLSTHITIVDPYLSTQPSVWKTFLLLLEKSVQNSPVSNKTIEVLFDGSKKNARSCAYILQALKNENLLFIDDFAQITFKDIRENGSEAIHNRYIITDLAGVSLPYGLVETNENETDEFSLLNEEVYLRRHHQYVELQAVDVQEEVSLK